MNRFPRPAKTRPRARSGARQALAVLAVGACLCLAVLGIEHYVSAQRAAVAVTAAPSDSEVYTGSVLYMPDVGDVCRQLLFDNHNGQFIDNGYVDCAHAAYRGGLDGSQGPTGRIRVISTAFRGQ
jgi:3-hydroxy-3-methylglutaryl CoA synthase